MNKLHCRLMLCSVFLFFISGGVFSQTVPKDIRSLIDTRFPGWRLTSYTIPQDCNLPDSIKPNPNVHSFYVCKLNLDTIPDYALRIVTGEGPNLMEYFIALLSEQSSHKIFVLDSCRAAHGVGERYLYVLKVGSTTNIFDDAHWKKITEFGKLSRIKRASVISFPVDALIIDPICEGWYKEVEISTYVYIKDRFYDFSSAD